MTERGEVEGVGEKKVGHEDGHVVAVLGVDRRAAATHGALVDHVVVEKRGDVNQLDGGGDAEEPVVHDASHRAADENQQAGAKHLASGEIHGRGNLVQQTAAGGERLEHVTLDAFLSQQRNRVNPDSRFSLLQSEFPVCSKGCRIIRKRDLISGRNPVLFAYSGM